MFSYNLVESHNLTKSIRKSLETDCAIMALTLQTMKFAFCLYKYFPYGGMQRNFIRIARTCQQRGHHIDVFTLHWQNAIPDDLNVVVIPVTALRNHRRYQQFQQTLQPLLQAGAYDAVVGFNKMPGLDVYYAADPCYKEKSHQLRGWLYRLSARYRHFCHYEKAVFNAATKTELMLISVAEKKHFMRHYGTLEQRFHLLPPGISKDRMAGTDAPQLRAQFRHEFGLDENHLVVLMVGSDYKRKGLDRLLLAVAALPPTLKLRVRVFVVGQAEGATFVKLAHHLNLQEQLIIVHERNDIPLFLQGSDVFVHPAYSEAAGMVILEAIIAGLPTLVTTVCGHAHHVQRAEAGLVIPEPFSQDVMNQHLATMLSNGSQRAAWRRQGIAYGQEQDLYRLHARACEIIEAKASA